MKQNILTSSVHMPISAAESMIRRELGVEGFDTIASIDAVEAPAPGIQQGCSRLLVAYCPELIRRALGTDRHVGACLPTVVFISSEGTTTTIQVLDPAAIVEFTDNPALIAVSIDALARIERALATVRAKAGVTRFSPSLERTRAANQ